MDNKVIYGIPMVRWVLATIAKANAQNNTSITHWRDAWGETYFELGGESESVARKGCPMKAAYGLWRSGRILQSSVERVDLAVKDVRNRYGKNAAYACLALDLLATGGRFDSAQELWSTTQDAYRRTVQEDPAVSEQGAVRIAKGLYDAGIAR